jgi:hypothetical protein
MLQGNCRRALRGGGRAKLFCPALGIGLDVPGQDRYN